MFDQRDLDRLISAMRANGVTQLRVGSGRNRLRLSLSLTPDALPATQPAPAPEARIVGARSPGIGTYLPRGADDGLPLLETGSKVAKDEVLGYLCHGPVRAMIVAPEAGQLTSAAPEKGTLLGFGDTVFTLEAQP